MYNMTLKGQLQNLTCQFDLMSNQVKMIHVMTQVDPKVYCTSFDAPLCGKHNEVMLVSVSILNQKL